MTTGACGINCDVCRLNLLGLCSSCGPGKSDSAAGKLAVQEKLLGSACPVLACAIMNCKNYCLRDCSQFPCENFKTGLYPFSKGFIRMQERRRENPAHRTDPMGKQIRVPEEYWKTFQRKDLKLLCTLTGSRIRQGKKLEFHFLNRRMCLDAEQSCIRSESGEEERNPMLELVALSYFNGVDRLYPVGSTQYMISTKDMKDSLYFEGRNRLRTEPVLRRFRNDINAFFECAKALGGRTMNFADASIVLYPFERVPVYYLLWNLDKEHKAECSVLFDRSAESIFAAPVIWGLVNLVNSYLLTC